MIHGNLDINGASKAKPYPTAGLQVIVYPNSTYEDGGTTYIRTSTGVGIPLVSGTGLDAIWDFSVLNDARFDKGSYVGNAYGLPEYYDFPYVNIYFDETTAATRYHWKLKDFHYANILAQSLLLDNQFFLRAKATTETSNEISEIYQINIYESEQTGVALDKLKSWIRIAPNFLGDNLLANPNFDTDTVWSKQNLGSIISDGLGILDTSIAANPMLFQNILRNNNIGDNYLLEYEITESSLTDFLYLYGDATNTYISFLTSIPHTLGYNQAIIIADQTGERVGVRVLGSDVGLVKFNYVSLKFIYINYYKP